MDKDKFTFKVNGITEDELDLILSIDRDNVKNVLNFIKSMGGSTICSTTTPKKVDKDYIRYNKKLYSILDNKMCIGFFYMLFTRGYSSINELYVAKQINWNAYINKIKKLGLIKLSKLTVNDKYYYRCKNGMNEHNVKRMKIYVLSSSGEQFFNEEYKQYVLDNVDDDFIKCLDEMQEEYDFFINMMGVEENVPDVITTYLTARNNKTFSKKILSELKQKILNNETLMEYIERYNIKL